MGIARAFVSWQVKVFRDQSKSSLRRISMIYFGSLINDILSSLLLNDGSSNAFFYAPPINIEVTRSSSIPTKTKDLLNLLASNSIYEQPSDAKTFKSLFKEVS